MTLKSLVTRFVFSLKAYECRQVLSNSVCFARDVGLAPKMRRDVTAFIMIGS